MGGDDTRAVADQDHLGMRGRPPRWWICALRRRSGAAGALRPGQPARVQGTEPHGRTRGRRRGYCNAAERFAKTRRLAVLRRPPRCGRAGVGCWSTVDHGGKRLWRNRNHLDATHMDEQQWRDRGLPRGCF